MSDPHSGEASALSTAVQRQLRDALADLVDTCYEEGSYRSYRCCRRCGWEHSHEAQPSDQTHERGCVVDEAEKALLSYAALSRCAPPQEPEHGDLQAMRQSETDGAVLPAMRQMAEPNGVGQSRALTAPAANRPSPASGAAADVSRPNQKAEEVVEGIAPSPAPPEPPAPRAQNAATISCVCEWET